MGRVEIARAWATAKRCALKSNVLVVSTRRRFLVNAARSAMTMNIRAAIPIGKDGRQYLRQLRLF